MNKIIISLFFFCLPVLTLQAQKDSTAYQKLEKYVRNIQTFNRLIPQEKVYLHFDNTSYVLGETIWFKAYVVTAAHNLPTAQSGVLYVELLNAKGKLLETKKLKIEAGQCHGEFSLTMLDMEYFPGYYEIRAYTKGMLNFGEETLFSRVFPVFASMKGNGTVSDDELDDDLDVQLPNHRPKAKKQKKVNLTFYPEGGHLVDGLMSVVAFKLTGQDGHGLEASGEVCNPEDETLTTFATVHAGMGSFTCIPDGRKNRVKIFHENKTYSFDLPKSLPQGYVLKVINLYSDNLMVQIEKSAEIPPSLLGLSILCRGEVSFFQTVNLDKEPCGLKISKEILATGVNQITLFDAKGEIFAERLFFISPREEDSAFIQAVPNKEAYSPLDLIQLDLLVGGHSGNKETSLSLAVRDAASLIETATDNIYTYLLLSSDLKGFIEAPDFYFASGKTGKTHELDLLMLVQGWKRYEWQTMAGVEPFVPQYNTEKSLTVKGFITSSEGKNTELIAQLQRSKNEVMDGKAQTDGKGVFYLYPEDFYGTWNLSMRAKGLTNAYKKIRLDRWFSPAPKAYAPFETRWKHPKAFPVREGNKKESLEEIDTDSGNRSRSFLIPEVQVNERRNKDINHPVGQDIDRMLDTGEKIPFDVHDYMVEKDIRYKYIPSDHPGTAAYGDESHINSLHDSNYGIFSYDDRLEAKFYYLQEDQWKTPYSIMVDATTKVYETFQKAIFMTARRNVLEVEKIVVSGFYRKDNFGDRHVPMYIYPANNYMMRVIPNIRYTTFEGYSTAKDFFSHPAISREDAFLDSHKHQRTLYWNPSVRTDADGKASIRFFNNRDCRKIDISVEGLMKNGIPLLSF